MNKTFSLWNRIRDGLSNLGEHPSYDWYFSLSCLAILSVCAMVFSGFIYYALALSPADSLDGLGAPVTITLEREALSKALSAMKVADASAALVPDAVLADPSRR